MTGEPHVAGAESRCPLVVLAGPTGVGKTAASLALAESFQGVVVNLDSRQIYADFPIVTAQPTAEERATCPHWLFGFLGTAERMAAGVFARMAGDAARLAWSRGRLPLLVGGTGLYLRALLHGLAEIPPIPNAVRQAVQAELLVHGPEALHAKLAEVDPATAARLAPRDRQRIARALEVHAATGHSLTWWHARQREQAAASPASPFAPLLLHLDLPPRELNDRLTRRIGLMLEQGALAEVVRAWERCPDPEAPGFSGIGCAELLSHLRSGGGERDLPEAIALWDRNTRAYAKRQRTWFRAEPGRVDLHPKDIDGMRRAVAAFLQPWSRAR